ncbi:hypothetical protein EMPG_17746 [Blastomyces silverae]|uniref:Uncharacterized protein n=1 Tax=Blastomyces silverae TaxID=2060906 RepID=A0A0H1B6X1_9EURO|nr:hypothetical protein EMPG_17746 [Blastomyces silverae]
MKYHHALAQTQLNNPLFLPELKKKRNKLEYRENQVSHPAAPSKSSQQTRHGKQPAAPHPLQNATKPLSPPSPCHLPDQATHQQKNLIIIIITIMIITIIITRITRIPKQLSTWP